MYIESPGRCGAATPRRLSFSPFHCQPNYIQNKIHCLLCGWLICYNAVIIQISDHRQLKYTFFGLDIGNICNPFAVGSVRNGRTSRYFTFGLTSFLWIAENHAATYSPFEAVPTPFEYPALVADRLFLVCPLVSFRSLLCRHVYAY